MSYTWLTEDSRHFLERDYLLPGVSIEERVNQITHKAAKNLDYGLPWAAKLEYYVSRGWVSFSTPVWTNFGNDRGAPISCFGSYIGDSINSILRVHSEVGKMSQLGGGTSGYFGDLRPRGAKIQGNGESTGPVHFMELFDKVINVISQGKTRRGSFAAYLPIEHDDFMEFMNIKTKGNPIQDLSFGVTVTDAFMQRLVDRDAEAMKRWARLLKSRSETGMPYIMFIDNANNQAPEWYRGKHKIYASNLCTEIMLPSSEEESFVCCLSSVNLSYYDEWKHTDLVYTMTEFLDAVMTEFIDKCEDVPHMENAVQFARRHRALGLGVLGWHDYLQKNFIAFDSMEAKLRTSKIFRDIRDEATRASQHLAAYLGEPEVMEGTGQRNATLLAIAPTKSSAIICGLASEGIEPHLSNYYVRDGAKGKVSFRNRELQKVLARVGQDTEAVWDSILANSGSVQHLSFLSADEKAVFKTFGEISPLEVIIQASIRQKFIDQGQSLNLRIHPSIPAKDVNALMIRAWELGIKSLYYQRSVNAAQEFARNILHCNSCE